MKEGVFILIYDFEKSFICTLPDSSLFGYLESIFEGTAKNLIGVNNNQRWKLRVLIFIAPFITHLCLQSIYMDLFRRRWPQLRLYC